MKLARQEDRRSTWSSCSSSWSSRRSPPACWSITIGNISFGEHQRRTRPSSSTPPAWSRATTSASPASRSASSPTSRSSTATRALVTFTVDETTPLSERDPRHDPLPQPGRPALHLADQDDRRRRARSTRARPIPVEPHPAGARPDRAVQRLQAALPGAVARATSTSSPTRSSRSSRARAAPSRACWPHRLGDPDPRRPRRGDRRPDRQPQRGARPRRRPRRAARPS